MIRYPVSSKGTVGADLAELRRRVTRLKPNWLERARKRTDKIAKARCYNESKGIWSEITDVFRKLQNHKCAFCERHVRQSGGTLEHFRPKSKVDAWPMKEKPLRKLKHLVNLNTGDPMDTGYYKLAYALLNYALACHHCNLILKKCYFPIAGSRKRRAAQDPTRYQAEQPFLIYPIGVLDEDPESLLHFLGIFPFPAEKNAGEYAHRRALITVLLFNLYNDSTLLLERALVIQTLYKALEGNDPEDQQTVSRMTSGKLAYTNCCKSFIHVYHQDKELAQKFYRKACRYIKTKVPVSS